MNRPYTAPSQKCKAFCDRLLAILGGHAHFVSLLLESGADPNHADRDGGIPIARAAQEGSLPIVNLLLENGADPNRRAGQGRCPLTVAAAHGHYAVVERLLQAGGLRRLPGDEDFSNSALVSAAGSDHPDVVKLLLENDENEPVSREEAQTALYCACLDGHENTSKVLVKWGADPNLLPASMLSPLRAAIQSGNLSLVQYLLSNGADPNQMTQWGTALHLAASLGAKEILDEILRHGADLEALDSFGRTPLVHAVVEGRTDIVEVLLKRGASPNPGDEVSSPLIFAILPGKTDIVRLLIAHGADPEWKGADGDTAIMLAASFGQQDIVQILLDAGANVNASDNWQTTALIKAVATSEEPSMVQFLIRHGAELDAADQWGRSALTMARELQYSQMERVLVEAGAVDAREQAKQEASEAAKLAAKQRRMIHEGLFGAARTGELKPMDDVFDLITTPDLRDDTGSTPFMMAAVNGHFEVANLLLEMGADANACDDQGQNALTKAIILDRSESIPYLKKLGCEKQEITDKPKKKRVKKPPADIVQAVMVNDLKRVRELLESGADPNQLDSAKRKTPLIIATENGNADMVLLLLQKRADPNAVDAASNTTALMLAAREDRYLICAHLLAAGADPNHAGHAGTTALMLAAQKGNFYVVEMLLRFGANADAKTPRDKTVRNMLKKKSPIPKLMARYAYPCGILRDATDKFRALMRAKREEIEEGDLLIASSSQIPWTLLVPKGPWDAHQIAWSLLQTSTNQPKAE